MNNNLLEGFILGSIHLGRLSQVGRTGAGLKNGRDEAVQKKAKAQSRKLEVCSGDSK